MKFAKEGFPFIFFFLIATVAIASLSVYPAIVPFLLTLFMLYFFRDPERNIPEDKNIFVSPADGEVILIKDVREQEHLKAAMKEISIFMSPFNVHVNRSPCDGTVKLVKHSKGAFLAAYRDEASIKNENIAMILETGYGDILVRQVAGFVARRAVCRKKEGEILKRGERYGIIKFSSRLDIYLPKDTLIKVKIGEKVKAGETVLGTLDDFQEKRP